MDGRRQFAFASTRIHANRNAVVHGGMLMTFIDRAFGTVAREVSGSHRSATISLSHQFGAPMQTGTIATLEPQLVNLTGQMAFLTGTIVIDDTPILEAQGVWRIWRR